MEHLRSGSIGRPDLLGLAALHLDVFGAKGRTVEEYADRLQAGWGMEPGQTAMDGLMHVVREGDRIVAKAASFGRVIGTTSGDLTVLALSGVATSPDHRGRGLGEAVVQAAFDRVRVGGYSVSLFQTSFKVQPFYERLGACLVDNSCVDPTHPEQQGFVDDVVMRYPADVAWPTGTLDLRGPGW